MALADFTCRTCSSRLETHDRIDGQPCQTDGCDGTYRRLWNVPTITLTGPGFYSTDY